MRRFIPEIVGADDGGVAAGIAAADPALFQDRHIGDAEFLGEVVGGGQPVAAAADDDDVVFALRLRAAPSLLPVLVIAERVPHQGEDRIGLFHACPRGAKGASLRFGADTAKAAKALQITARHLMSRTRRWVNRVRAASA